MPQDQVFNNLYHDLSRYNRESLAAPKFYEHCRRGTANTAKIRQDLQVHNCRS